jgi:hypothetical protein
VPPCAGVGAARRLPRARAKTQQRKCSRRDAAPLALNEGLQPRANERHPVGCSVKLGGGNHFKFVYFSWMNRSCVQLSEFLSFCAFVPALIIGVLTMRQLGVRTSVWSLNLAAAGAGLLVFAVMTSTRPTTAESTWHWRALGSITAILATFTSSGSNGVHRWVSASGFQLHASSLVAPVLIVCVATAARKRLAIGVAVVTALLLALQPDAAQTSSFAAGCGVVLVCDSKFGQRARVFGTVALIACTIASLLRVDPLKPVRHVEGIFEAASANGTPLAVLATVALVLLPTPFFVGWLRHRQTVALALCVYVLSTVLAPAWGTFPVPIMGYGVSPILGYCVALASCVRSALPAVAAAEGSSSSA